MPGMDPLVSFHFALDVQSTITGYFAEVSGLGSETEVVEQKIMAPDGHTQIVRKLPGRLKWDNITLKRGITDNMDMWKWRKQVEDGNVEGARKNGTVTMFDQVGGAIAEWTFDKAWPSKVTGPAIKADSNEIGVEEMVLVHEGIRRTK